MAVNAPNNPNAAAATQAREVRAVADLIIRTAASGVTRNSKEYLERIFEDDEEGLSKSGKSEGLV